MFQLAEWLKVDTHLVFVRLNYELNILWLTYDGLDFEVFKYDIYLQA